MHSHPLLAAVDLGSNSFRLQIARVEDDQFYMLDSLREPVRLAAGLTPDKLLDAATQERALAALARFGERLRGLPREAVRAVGTNTLRVARNAPQFLARAEAVLGFPIDIIAGREEARLIYLGVSRTLPPSTTDRLVIDIGGGSTEFIIGNGHTPLLLESLYMGCVSYSKRFFPDNKVSKASLKAAELAARNELEHIVGDFRGRWQQAYGSSGTAKALCEILEMNGYSAHGITREGLERLRDYMLKTGEVSRFKLQGLRPDRLPALPGGFAILHAAFAALEIEQMEFVASALREGVLYDLWGRNHDDDMREVTVRQFMQRYRVDPLQAARVGKLACALAQQCLGIEAAGEVLRQLEWAASLHEIGISVAHSGYHKHSAYILTNADMPGFARKEQQRLGRLVLAHRGNLGKMRGLLDDPTERMMALCLRLAALFCRSRSASTFPVMQAEWGTAHFQLTLPANWLKQNPLTASALNEEVRQWEILGLAFRFHAN